MNEDQLVDRLIALCEGTEIESLLRQQRGSLTESVIRRLKDQVSRWVHVDVLRATRLAEVTRQAAALTGDPICEALAAHAYAQAVHIAGHYAEAIEFYEQAEAAYARLGQDVETARVARAKLVALTFLGEYERALQEASRACDVFRQHQQNVLLAQTLENMANIYYRLDQYQEALRLYETAGDLYAAENDQRGIGTSSFNAANQYVCLNDFDRALTLYEQARAVYEELEMPLLVNQIDYSIAWLYFQRGKFQESLRLFVKVSARSKELGDAIQEAFCDLDITEVYLQLNAYEDALGTAHSAADKFGAFRMSYECAKARMYLGIAHTHLQDLAAAEQELQEARRGFQGEGNRVFTALTDVYLGDVYTRLAHWDQALQRFIEARQIFHDQGLSAKAAYADLQLARLKMILGEPDAAGSLCRSALQLIDRAEAPWLRYQCFHLLGNLKQKAGQEKEAYEYYTRAIQDLEVLRGSIRLDEFRCTFISDKLRVYEDIVDLCLRVGTEDKIEEAFSHIEAAKSRSLVDLMATEREIVSKSQEPSTQHLLQQWNRLREELNWYYHRINHYQTRSGPHAGVLMTDLQDEVQTRERELARLDRRLRLEDVEYTSLHEAAHANLANLQQSLAADEVLLEYYIVHGRVSLFVVSHERIRMFKGMATVETVSPLVQWLRFNFEQFVFTDVYGQEGLGAVRNLTRQYLAQLYQSLVKPVEPLLQGKKLIIVPHGLLHYLPFHALYDGQQYLIDRHEISYAPSASAYKLCADKAAVQRAGDRVLIVGVPDEAAPRIEDEMVALKSLWDDARVLQGAAATLEEVRALAPDCRLLHLASHGVFRRDNPMFSALKLSDAWLNLYDIFNLDLQAELVTLSACETGMNEVFPGDELFGLVRGFLYAGTPSLVVSSWVVHDRSTTDLMRWFYTGLKDGLTKRAALRKAQLTVKQEYEDPYYWAPFILMGAP